MIKPCKGDKTVSDNVYYNVRTTFNGNLTVFLPSEHGSDRRVFVNRRGTWVVRDGSNPDHGWEQKIGLTKSEAFAIAAVVQAAYYGNAGARVVRLKGGTDFTVMGPHWTAAVYALAAEKLRKVQSDRPQEKGTGGGLE